MRYVAALLLLALAACEHDPRPNPGTPSRGPVESEMRCSWASSTVGPQKKDTES